MTTKRRPRLIRVAIVETTVLGIDAYHASCLECGWRCHRQAHDDEDTAVRCAGRHNNCKGATK